MQNPIDKRLQALQNLVKNTDSLHINSTLLAYSGIVEYHPEELVMTVKASTPIAQINTQLKKNNQALPFYANDNTSIGATYANGGQTLSDSILGIQIINGNGDLLNFGGQVMKNVAGYDVARLLVGSKGKLAMLTQVSFKVMPMAYIGELSPPNKQQSASKLRMDIEKRLKMVFDPRGVFQ